MDDLIIVRSATIHDLHFASAIIAEIASSAKARGVVLPKEAKLIYMKRCWTERLL
ncbi:hypothetical protein LWM68_07350 [Niabella sp. W65]|nr:hypothetical protein [Niabella sp. W65]MCH7362605.1 hypothetical protein [Niabella sp. W65]ULT38559.1 hypothetical protein KRR40_26005 [Niabella sp. I65]